MANVWMSSASKGSAEAILSGGDSEQWSLGYSFGLMCAAFGLQLVACGLCAKLSPRALVAQQPKPRHNEHAVNDDAGDEDTGMAPLVLVRAAAGVYE